MADIEVTREDDIATVTISNPARRNAIDAEACAVMADELRELAYNTSIRCVVVESEGDAFCAGIDLTEGIGDGGVMGELESGLNAVATVLLRMEKPTIAKVSGPAVGAGASIATACDFVYAAESAEFGWGFTDIGLAPDTGATWVLPRLVGVRRALDLLVTARRVPAPEAVDLGIATEAIPDDELTATVAERVATLADRPTRAVAHTKRLVYRNWHRPVEAGLRAEARAQAQVARTEDFSEGVMAFFEDREPEFEGR